MVKTFYYERTKFISCKGCLLIFSFLLCFACKEKEPEIKLLFTGDILLSRNVEVEIERGQKDPWEDLTELFKSADLVVGNLEGAVGERSQDDSLSNLIFDIKEKHLPLLPNAGFHVMTIENNHSSDVAKDGKSKTADALLKNNIIPVSYESSPHFINVKGKVIALVAINLVKDKYGQRQEIPSVELKQKLRFASGTANVTIVCVHWGVELAEWTVDAQKQAAAWLVKNGADIIIGHHPHVIQKPEMVEGKPIFFSLGNHLFDQKYPSTKTGLIADCRIANGKVEFKGIVTKTKDKSFYSKIDGEESLNLNPVKLHTQMNLKGYDILPVSTNDGEIILHGYKSGKKVWASEPLPVVSLEKVNNVSDTYLFCLQNRYSSLDKEQALRPYVYDIDDKGLIAKWRGSSLAWPIIDATAIKSDSFKICVLHRGDSYLQLNKNEKTTRLAKYKWNGFGFSILKSEFCEPCFEH